MHDAESKEWVEQLQSGHPSHEQALARLSGVLRRVAFHELSRRREQLGSITGREFDDLARQAADDALVNILRKLDEFRGLSRFTTWAFDVSDKVARYVWRRQPPSSEELDWDRLPDWLATHPSDRLEQRECEARNAAWSYRAPFEEVRRSADLVSFYVEKVTITIDGEKLDPVPGQSVLPHCPDRNLSVDEICGIELVEPATVASA